MKCKIGCIVIVLLFSLVIIPISSAEFTASEKAEIQANANYVHQELPAPPDYRRADTKQTWYYYSDFEANDGGWIIDTGTYGEWEWGTIVPGVQAGCDDAYPEPSGAFSGVNVWASDLDGCYDNAGDDSVLYQTFNFSSISAPIYLSWYNWYNFFYSFDYCEVRVNGTMLWEISTSTATPDYIRESIDISAYAGQAAVTVEFYYYATSVVNRMGWYLDDVGIGDFDPLAVDLLSFKAQVVKGGANLVWETAAEYDTLGFNLVRYNIRGDGTLSKGIQINKALIPAEGSAHSGATYSFLDHGIQPFGSYRFALVEVANDGVKSELATVDLTAGPVRE